MEDGIQKAETFEYLDDWLNIRNIKNQGVSNRLTEVKSTWKPRCDNSLSDRCRIRCSVRVIKAEIEK